ncbi:DNA polymerase subunit gamma-1, mitochondrial [Ischnura elegans]|uniref:DNA polymerase subunit gamma-1, mitochondrial n=1 Tax=Ischnura elegans TaxID=197161 RepID=UPI001ED8AC97|nr:DNA polymerase subunit gamma-1, mitochondrial [Ischnura elegans]
MVRNKFVHRFLGRAQKPSCIKELLSPNLNEGICFIYSSNCDSVERKNDYQGKNRGLSRREPLKGSIQEPDLKAKRNHGRVTYKIIKKSASPPSDAVRGLKKTASLETVNDEYVDTTSDEKRVNALGIQMLSRSLYRQIFGNGEPKPTSEQITRAKKNLQSHGLLDKPTSTVQDISSLALPVLRGGTIESHFQEIGEEQAGPYRLLLQKLVSSTLPSPPQEWSRLTGWTRYGPNGARERVDFPDEDSLVFDVEVCRAVGEVPTLATAVSPTHWYSWVCHWLAEDGGDGDPGPPRDGRPITLEELIPLESAVTDSSHKQSNRVRIVVAHHASYDRARVREQYWPQGTGLRFFDTLSTHVCIGGVSSYQRAILSADERRRKSSRVKGSGSSDDSVPSEVELDDNAWREVASLNSLAEAHRLHCGRPGLDKKSRDAFSPESPPSEILTRFQELMAYCSNDTKATHELLCALIPQFLERFPHPVTLAGMLELGTARLPVPLSVWNQYLMEASQVHDELESDLKLKLIRKANEACRQVEIDSLGYQKDLWMWDQDWSTQNLTPKRGIPSKARVKDPPKKPVSEFKNFLSVEENEDLSEEEMRLSLKFWDLVESSKNLPARRPHMPGYPKWYRQLCPKPPTSDEDDEWVPEPTLLTANARVASKLFQLCWEKYPLHYIQGHGWGVLVPGRPLPDDFDPGSLKEPQPPLKELVNFCPVPDSIKSSFENIGVNITPMQVQGMVEEYMSISEWVRRKKSRVKDVNKTPHWYEGSGRLCADVDIPGVWFCRLPHRDGPGKRVGNPLAKDFLEAASDATLSSGDLSEGPSAAGSALTIGKMVSYWRNNRDRIGSQLVVRLPSKGKVSTAMSDDAVILPQVIVCGTLTRRAVEPTWMTASNAERDRIGSELRGMVRPSKFRECMVGADVDSQELWIAALLGDAADSSSDFKDGKWENSGLHGGTPLGWRTLQGRKSDGTDMHSATAAAVGCSRDQAKVLNYARIYGAGRRFATRLLQRFNPNLTDLEASKKADIMMALTKGKRNRKVMKTDEHEQPEYEEEFVWEGGSESAMFNALEKVARMPQPVTPFLKARLSRALEPERVGSRFLPTRVNWVVQSGAVDFLHLLLVAMRSLSPGVPPSSSTSSYLRSKFDVRFALSFHDEVRYLVPLAGRYEAALRLHVAHLMVRAFCAHQSGLGDLPMSVAFFSGVSVDGVMRKEPDDECITPSNPHGLNRGHGVPPGESLDIYTALDKVQGRYTLAPVQKVNMSKLKKTRITN